LVSQATSPKWLHQLAPFLRSEKILCAIADKSFWHHQILIDIANGIIQFNGSVD
jgi:hypothetical protein